MSTRIDPLSSKPQVPDRVFYANGALLDQEDFTVEQTYHRGRMGRVLAYLHGFGTVAGLEVILESGEEEGEEERLKVTPGLAIDRLGRMIEVPRCACLRLGRWFNDQLADPESYDRLSNSFRSDTNVVVVDVFIKFEACERGKQPAFATSNFDALDAIAPSRLRDSYRLEMVIREEQTLPIPEPGFPDLTGMTPEQVKEQVILYKLQEAWKEPMDWGGTGGTLSLLPDEHAQGQDGTELLLARLLIPAILNQDQNPPLQRNSNEDVNIDNTLRRFVFSTAELVWLEGRLR